MPGYRHKPTPEFPEMHETVEERILFIMGMMRRLEWERGETGYALAKKWRMSQTSVDKWASEASRRVKAEVTDPDYVSMHVGLALREVIEGAREDVKKGLIVEKQTDDGPIYVEVDPNKSRASIIAASKTWADLSGAMAPARTKLEIAPAALSDDELAKALPEALRVARERGVLPVASDAEASDDVSPDETHAPAREPS